MTSAAASEEPYEIRAFNGEPDGVPLVIAARDERAAHRLCAWIAAQRSLLDSQFSIHHSTFDHERGKS